MNISSLITVAVLAAWIFLGVLWNPTPSCDEKALANTHENRLAAAISADTKADFAPNTPPVAAPVVPAPVPAQSPVPVPATADKPAYKSQEEQRVLEALYTIRFEKNSDKLVLTPEIERYFGLLRDRLKQYPNLAVSVTGYSDDSGLAATNDRITKKRAKDVRNHLTKLGIAYRQMRVTGKGSANPVAPNDAEENRALNRRVEIRLNQ